MIHTCSRINFVPSWQVKSKKQKNKNFYNLIPWLVCCRVGAGSAFSCMTEEQRFRFENTRVQGFIIVIFSLLLSSFPLVKTFFVPKKNNRKKASNKLTILCRF